MRVLSGIQPSGDYLHLGNYFGAIRQQVALAKEHEALLFIADYHSMTSVRDGARRREFSMAVALDYLACGLDPERTLLLPVALAEELPARETIELVERVRSELSIHVDRVVVVRAGVVDAARDVVALSLQHVRQVELEGRLVPTHDEQVRVAHGMYAQ